jgi:predicted dehydrogenase
MRVAVIGAGAFGEQHARVLKDLPGVELVAVADPNLERARAVCKFAHQAVEDYRTLIGRIDAATVAVPTVLHAEIGVELLRAEVDVLVEKPLAADLEGADRLIEAARQSGRILAVGHLERFNPAVEAAAKLAKLPLFFEVHRMSPFTPRSLDIDVVLDLMIHDLDIVLSLVDCEIQEVRAVGLPVLTDKPDIAHVRVQFANGCVANFTASRVSTERIRKLRFFQPRQYVSVDYSRQDGAVFAVGTSKQVEMRPLEVSKGEPLQREMESFVDSVRNRTRPRVGGEEGRKALAAALRIRGEMESHARVVAATLAGQVK